VKGVLGETDHYILHTCIHHCSSQSAGYKLSALEIERELLSHPLILEAAVIGLPDDTLGEKVVAVIALRAGAEGGSLLEHPALREALTKYLQDKLARYKQPRDYFVVEAIPRNHMGKVSCSVQS
jgi:malonyl-CoA/methylmalonyl-CoA synthetase